MQINRPKTCRRRVIFHLGSQTVLVPLCSPTAARDWRATALFDSAAGLLFRSAFKAGENDGHDPLRDYLRQQSTGEFPLSFREIEKILAGPLPTSALKHQWWANELSPNTSHVQQRAWGDAGYNAFLHAGRKVGFSRVG
jgi:hypothetical protein